MKTIDELISTMTLGEKVGQLIHTGAKEDASGWPSGDMETLIKEHHIGGVRIYSRKGNPAFYRAYTNQLQEWALSTRLGIPLIIATDAEPGLTDVVRYGVSVWPWAAGLSACDSPETTRAVSAAIARESLAVGINCNQRPVADVNVNPSNPIVGLRSPSNDTRMVCDQVEAAIQGARSEGLITCAKHFPGHGDTGFDSHLELGTIEGSLQELREVHLAPFVRAITAGVDIIMTCHVIVRCLDPRFPATLSHEVMTGLLRNELGFQGVVITDSMGMLAIQNHYGADYATVQAIKAGCDLLIARPEVRDAILKALGSGDLSEERLNESVRRILRLKASRDWFESSRIGSVASAVHAFGSEEQVAFNERVVARAMTLVKNDGVLPLRPEDKVLLTGVCDVHPVADALTGRGLRVTACELRSGDEQPDWSPASDDIESVLSLASRSDVVVVLTYTYQGRLPEGQQTLLRRLIQSRARIVVVALGLPYDAVDTGGIAGYLLTYFHAYRIPRYRPLPEVFSRVLVDVLIGERSPGGKCPFVLR